MSIRGADIRRLAAVARSRAHRVFDAPTGLGTWAAIVLTVVLTGAAAALLHLMGGAPHAVVHAFYLPIILAASRFDWRGAVATAVAAGLLAGPVASLDPGTGSPQAVGEWGVRLGAFVTIGVVVAWLSAESSRSIAVVIADTRGVRRLGRALDRNELVAHYQPIVDLRSNHVVGFEALCRWQDPVRGTVPPSAFIPLAERTGLVVPVGTFMLDEAARQTAAWHRAGTRGLVISVNVSANHLCHPDFVAHIVAALAGAGLEAGSLCVEITETAIIRDRDTALANITRIHELGVLISVDDFGTGQSSLAYLQDFPIDVVKIDQSFVSRVDLDPKCSALVLAIIQMARALGATTVGEGIERLSQLQALRALGCTQGQGYYLGRPAAPLDADAPGLRPDARVLVGRSAAERVT